MKQIKFFFWLILLILLILLEYFYLKTDKNAKKHYTKIIQDKR